ncbi:adenine deaminase [Halobacillus yeomjeoni]|uniref:Adenine deaminase n=1 Tax=Halobacillus yeomjeoni TaxID=311194 RepID=A0A931MSW2_9BACI|nr:adenine deaminase [Halobacillus yeomjeoni]MBH0228598.1 adenine deaminase [Halobacillus yeomjeoni]
MKTNHKSMKKHLQIASKQRPADLVVKNGRVMDVFNQEWMDADIAVADGKIVGIGDFEGTEIIDAQGNYVCPSFIDGHVHIESSMVPPSEFEKVVLPHGVTSIITDPHEIANVSGKAGIDYMLKNSNDIDLDVFFMLPSCVPATSFENAGAVLKAEDLKPFMEHERVLGLAEVMDYPSLLSQKDDMLDKIEMTADMGGKMDGHLAGLNTDAINVYRTAGIDTDHECTTIPDAMERLRRGMYLLIRQGSVAKELLQLIDIVTPANARRCLFCTDDKHIDDLIEEGSIDHHVRLSIKKGLPAFTAYQMASLNAAECYGLKNKGALAPGYDADFLIVDDLEDVHIKNVYKAGKQVAADGQYIAASEKKNLKDSSIMDTVLFKPVQQQDLEIDMDDSKHANVIEINPNQLKTNKIITQVGTKENLFVPSLEHDLQKMVVVERHHLTGNIGVGIVKGFGLKDGAIATTIAHDSHNIVATGTNDEDLLRAINALKEMRGGLVVVKQEEVIASLPLPISGLMSEKSYKEVDQQLKHMKRALKKLGFEADFNPFLTLSFLTLPVIPSLKLTDKGLFDVESFKYTSVGAERT